MQVYGNRACNKNIGSVDEGRGVQFAKPSSKKFKSFIQDTKDDRLFKSRLAMHTHEEINSGNSEERKGVQRKVKGIESVKSVKSIGSPNSLRGLKSVKSMKV